MSHQPLTPLPDPFVQRMRSILPPSQFERVLASFATEKATSFRVNTLLTSIPAVQQRLETAGFTLSPLPWCAGGFFVPHTQRRSLTECQAFSAGHIYIQNPASMLASLALNPLSGDRVLDLAAAPGGKTSHLAALMQNQGQIIAVESVKGRFFRLKANLDRLGATMAEAVLMDGRGAGRRWPNAFDRILLDAPCSSEARFTQLDPTSWSHWSVRKIREAAHKQKSLLRSAIDALRPGGTLVYCTCSFAPEENEAVVNSQLRHYETISVERLELPLGHVQSGLTSWQNKAYDPRLERAVRILPDTMFDGLFLCRLHKRA